MRRKAKKPAGPNADGGGDGDEDGEENGEAEALEGAWARLDAALHAALYETTHRSDDLEFVVAARGWSQCISFGNFELYKERFMNTAGFFESRFEEATKVGSAMIQALMDS